jgi:hypothetical protein
VHASRESGNNETPIQPATSIMNTDETTEVPEDPRVAAERQRRRDLRRAVAFGVIMATIQMGILLYFMYC